MIHRLRVQNFKSIVDVDVELSPVTVLIGKSGSGKSNFVQALRFLRDVLISPQDLQQSFPQVRAAMAPDALTTFSVQFSVAGIEEKFHYELAICQFGPEHWPDNERLLLGNQCLFHQKASSLTSVSWLVEPKLLKVPSAGPLALGRLPSISEIAIAFTALTSGIGCYVFSDKVLCGPQRRDQRRWGLSDDAGNFVDAVHEIHTDLQDLTVRRSIVASLQYVNPSVSSIGLNDIQSPSSVVVGHRVDGKTLDLDLSQESEGFRRFYAYLLAIYQRPPKQTLLFEHPEDGIHPGLLSLLADELKAAPTDGRGQVILTTHSPQLLDHFDVDQIRVVELADLKTRIGPITSKQREAIRDGLLEPGELLTFDEAQMQPEATGA